MWVTQSLWFEIAIVSIIFALGNILMGHFEERTPKIRRVGKYILTVVIVCTVSALFGRTTSITLLSISLLYRFFIYMPITYQRKRESMDGQENLKVNIMNFEIGTRTYFLINSTNAKWWLSLKFGN